ncbi:chloride channel protein [Apiospora marii]|uniref:chloride channel protein n=1 Tax=Apiospora marii TaxID=335849 RepID=UPI0031301B5E
MSSRTTSFSAAPLTRRPSSLTSRLSFAVSTAERGEGHDAPAAQQIDEEIAEIKRYELLRNLANVHLPPGLYHDRYAPSSSLARGYHDTDKPSTDWVQDAAREQLRRKAKRHKNAGLFDNGQVTWRHRVAESYDAAQGWIVVTLIGAAIGFNAAFLNIITEWLSDIKTGYCTTGFYLNESFCCWGEDNGCADWHPWTGFGPANYVIYILFGTFFACLSATLVKSFAPYAAGSGISEIKCIIAGFVMKGFLGLWTLIIKSIALPLAIGSGLSVGKEGPSVHYAVCTGNVISRLFEKYARNASKTREILSACAAAGVAVAFGSPIGGVLFSLEEMSNYFPLKTLWRSYFCALVATAVLAAMNPFRTGQLVMFQVHYDRSWHFFEVFFYIILGVFGGLYGAFVMKWNLRVQAFRKKYLTKYAVLEATLLAAGTAIICYPNVFLRIDMTESMEILFLECEGAEDYQGLCENDRRWSNILSLLLATVIRIFLVIISYGCKVPAGIFVPSMAIGASFGRTIGIIVQALHDSYPQSVFFASCLPDLPCITPGTYAFLGAAAALSGIMHITVSVVVIMFELTGALDYILPTMIVVGVTKAVSEMFGGFPFLDNKEDHNFGVPVQSVMTNDIVTIPIQGMTLQSVEDLLSQPKYQGFPIVEDVNTRILVGYIGRTELRYAIDRLRRERQITISPQAKCSFSPSNVAGAIPVTPTVTVSNTDYNISSSASTIDFSRYVDPTPVMVHPRLPLETVMDMFRKIGPRVILIEYHGRLAGLVTVKDCLKYQFKVEAEENPHASHDVQKGNEVLWGWIQTAGFWVSGKLSSASGGRIRLGSTEIQGAGRPHVGRGGIMDGDEDLGDEGGVELENR